MPTKDEKVDPKMMEQLTERYTAETVGVCLNQTFDKLESVASILGTSPLERGDHIVIDGRTVREILAEEFARDHGRTEDKFQAEFNTYYHSQGKKLVHERVAEAMVTGKWVDFYIPNPYTGRIEEEPSKLVGMGFESNPIKQPAQMTRCQRFWSKLGCYGDKAAEQKIYKRRVEAQKRVRFYNKVGRAQMACVGSQFAEISAGWKECYPERKDLDLLELPPRGPYRLSRQGMACYVNCLLAVQKDKAGKPLYTNEQLFDMQSPDMRQARADASEEIYRHSMVGMNGDQIWLCRLQHESRIDLKARIDEQGRNLNFCGRDVTEQKGYREFSMLANTAFELSQEAVKNKQLNEIYGENEDEKFRTELNELPDAIEMIHDSLVEQKRILCGEASLSANDATRRMARVVMGQAALFYFAKQQAAGVFAPDFAGEQSADTISGVDTQTLLGDTGEGAVAQQVRALRDEYLSNPKKFSAQIENGVLNQRIQIKEFGEGSR